MASIADCRVPEALELATRLAGPLAIATEMLGVVLAAPIPDSGEENVKLPSVKVYVEEPDAVDAVLLMLSPVAAEAELLAIVTVPVPAEAV